jgi:hypothetical protein
MIQLVIRAIRHATLLYLMFLSSLVSDVSAEEANSDQGDLGRVEVPEEQRALLERVLVNNRKSYESVNDTQYYVDFTWSQRANEQPTQLPGFSMPGGTRQTEGNTRIWRKGSWYHQDLNLVHTYLNGTLDDASCEMVLNDRYFARYFKFLNYIELYRFESFSSMPESVHSMTKMFPRPEIMKFGFKAGSSLLQEKFENQSGFSPPAFRWTVASDDTLGRARLMVRSERLGDDSTWLREESVVEPERDYLVSEHRWYDSDGSLLMETKVDLIEVPDGRWFPSSANQFRRAKEEKSKYEVREVRIGDTIPDSQFTLESMTFDRDSVTILETPIGGKSIVSKGYLKGEWVALESLPAERREHLMRVREEASKATRRQRGRL